MSELSRIEQAREQLPEVIGQAARVIADNPGQFGLVLAGSVVGTRIMANLVKPRTLFEAVCTAAVTHVLLMTGLGQARKHGLITFRLRDADGKLIEPGAPGGDSAD